MGISHDQKRPGSDKEPMSLPGAPDDGPMEADDLEHENVEEPIGNDNIREGRVRGVMGGPRAQEGEGQGG